MINVEKLKEVLEFYKAFAQTFSRNLTLTYDLSKRTVFYKVAEKRLERILGAVQHHEPPFTPAQVIRLIIQLSIHVQLRSFSRNEQYKERMS